MATLDENPVITKFWKLYGLSFASLYLYCARRATTKPVIAFIMKSLYENAFDEMKHGEEITLPYLYKWAYEFFSVQSQPGAAGGAVKRVHDFRDVYDIKTDSGSRAIKREQLLENFYTQLSAKEREVLWLTFFEELLPSDRAFVMGMDEDACMKLYYDTLKKAKEVVSMATSHQRGLRALASYFGSVVSLLKKAKEHEDIVVDQEIFTSLKSLFMEQFSRMQPQPARAQPISTTATSSAVETKDFENDFDDDMQDEFMDDEGFGQALWRKLQGAALVLVVIVVGMFGYFRFFSENARVARLLDDSRVHFTADFNDQQKKDFAKEALTYLAGGRDYSSVQVLQRPRGMVEVTFDIASGGGRESFLIYPQVQSFDSKFKWQPKEYVRLKAV